MKPKVLVILGPTSSGKSALAVELARKFGGEVISADSRQVYRGLDIGTGKITKREMNGGTGFYIDALVGRIVLPNVPPNKKLRVRLEKKSAAQLYALLKKKDPRRAKAIEPHHKRRLIRALEIAAAFGSVPMMEIVSPSFDVLWVGITLQSKVLEQKIRARLLARMKRGMVAEAKRLHAGGLSYKRMEELGLEYRSLARLLQGAIARKQMVEELDRATRKYAMRQMRYWKRNKDIRWFETNDDRQITARVHSWLRK